MSPRKLGGDSIIYWTENLPGGRTLTRREIAIDGEPVPERPRGRADERLGRLKPSSEPRAGARSPAGRQA